MSKYDELRRLREAQYAAPERPVAPPPVAPPSAPTVPARFDRNAYHKVYMREYMRRRRAKG